ncbi:MAG: ribulose-phosphate 3-epimerase [bacterium]
MIKISPSILSADFIRLGEEVDSVRTADELHFDVMDGDFVPNLSFGIPVLKAVRDYTDMVIDAHLMIQKPLRHVEGICRAGADYVVIHMEADTPENISLAIDLIRARGKKAGLALKPATSASVLLPYLDRLNKVLCMTVEPGFGGQTMKIEVLDKVREVRRMVDERGLDCDVAVDGGVNRGTATLCKAAGANCLVIGNGIFKKTDRAAYISEIRSLLA